MQLSRRETLGALGALGVAAFTAAADPAPAAARAAAAPQETPMHGLIGKMTSTPGQRDALIAIMLEGVRDMPGCLSYIVAKNAEDEHGIWITEVWDSEASHKASLALPAVRDAIARAKPLIAGFSHHTVTIPVGGHGLAPK